MFIILMHIGCFVKLFGNASFFRRIFFSIRNIIFSLCIFMFFFHFTAVTVNILHELINSAIHYLWIMEMCVLLLSTKLYYFTKSDLCSRDFNM